MSSKTLIIFNSNTLFEILQEIKENFNFEIIALIKNKIDQVNLSKFEDYVIISDHENELENCNIIDVPKKLEQILEQIIIWFLGIKFSSQ